MRKCGGVRTETLRSKNQTLNPKYATTLTTHTAAQVAARQYHQPTRYRYKQRRPFIRQL